MYPIIPKKLKGSYIFWPSDQTQGTLSNTMGQNTTATALLAPADMHFGLGTGSDISAPHSTLPLQFTPLPSSSIIQSPPSRLIQSPPSFIMQSQPILQPQLSQSMRPLPSPMQQSSPVQPSYQSSSVGPSSLGSKCKGSPQSLPSIFVNNLMSTSGGSSHVMGSQKHQKISGPAAILATSDQLCDFNTTIKDFLGAKEESRR